MAESRRSAIVKVSLVSLLGAVIIGDKVIPQGTEMRRNLYPDRAACERDYPVSQCEQTNVSGGGSGGYRGPYYVADRTSPAARSDPGPGRVGTRVAFETSTRGGFGAFGHAVHAAA
jgi:hypothetical protein